MGKYMRKGKGVGKMAVMEVSQGGSQGVRTRARALALENDRRLAQTSRSSESLKQSDQAECDESHDIYMELRSRRLEKVARCSLGRDDDVAQAAKAFQKSVSDCGRPSDVSNSDMAVDKPFIHELPTTSRGRPGFSLQASAEGSDGSQTRPAQLSLQSSMKGSRSTAVLPRSHSSTASAQSKSVSSQTRPPGILTRHQRHELAKLDIQESKEVNREAGCSMEAGPSRGVEMEPCFGESPTIAGPSVRDDSQVSHGEGSRRRNREDTPESYNRDVEGPGSTSRTHPGRRQGRSFSAPPFSRANEAPSSREIEAFFEGVEQQDRRRFMERYNFDPLTERPFGGRYEWVSM